MITLKDFGGFTTSSMTWKIFRTLIQEDAIGYEWQKWEPVLIFFWNNLIEIYFVKGTDITEAFESFHLTGKAPKILPKFFVRNAKEPRNYKFTYEENGFFRSLKRRAEERLKTLDTRVQWKSNILFDINFVAFFVAAVFAARVENLYLKFLLTMITSLFMTWVALMSHNYIHQRDNWRMYGTNFIMFGYTWREWRVFHAMVSWKYNRSNFALKLAFDTSNSKNTSLI